MYTGIPYGEYLDTPQCRVSVDNVRMKFWYKYRSYDFETYETVLAIDQYSQRLDKLHLLREWLWCGRPPFDTLDRIVKQRRQTAAYRPEIRKKAEKS